MQRREQAKHWLALEVSFSLDRAIIFTKRSIQFYAGPITRCKCCLTDKTKEEKENEKKNREKTIYRTVPILVPPTKTRSPITKPGEVVGDFEIGVEAGGVALAEPPEGNGEAGPTF